MVPWMRAALTSGYHKDLGQEGTVLLIVQLLLSLSKDCAENITIVKSRFVIIPEGIINQGDTHSRTPLTLAHVCTYPGAPRGIACGTAS